MSSFAWLWLTILGAIILSIVPDFWLFLAFPFILAYLAAKNEEAEKSGSSLIDEFSKMMIDKDKYIKK
jgi:uncharacterized membrane protein YedE/YeeE